jgi:hypothetical protein
MHISKRNLIASLASLPLMTACADLLYDPADPSSRFRGIGVVLVVDAVPGVDLKGVEFYDDRQYLIYAKSTQSQRNRDIMALGGARVPVTVRVVWHDSTKLIRRKDNPNIITYDGNIIGDYTLPIAQRIPAELLKDIRSRGGALRLKFRLKADGVLFGWDIERAGRNLSEFYMPGGDFKEARIYNGKAIEPGWYIDQNGTKIMTDY